MAAPATSAGLANAFSAAADAGRAAFVPYVTVGYPTIDATVGIMKAMQEGGADVIELGVPFSDPLADGPTIQAANQQALKNGATVHTALEAVRKARESGVTAPIVLMGYLNPFLSYDPQGGVAAFIQAAAAAGADGFIVVDLPPDEAPAKEWIEACTSTGLAYVPLVAPTSTDERLGELVAATDGACGYVYCVSIAGVTGARTSVPEYLPAFIGRVRGAFGASVPLVVGFGISTAEHVRHMKEVVGADGAVVGSAVIRAAAAAAADGSSPADAVKALVQDLTAPAATA